MAVLLPNVPMPMDYTQADALEWPRLRAMVASFADSAPGRGWVEGLEPSRDARWIEAQRRRVAEFALLLEGGHGLAFAGLADLSEQLALARVEGVALETVELLAIARLAQRLMEYRALLLSPPEAATGRTESLLTRAGALLAEGAGRQLEALSRAIESKIEPDGSIAEGASSELRRIRREIERQKRAIEEGLRGTLRKLSADSATQDDLVTIRGERFVIPIKAEWKRRVPGVVHGASSSGQTVYVEPLETIEQNNELVRLHEEELEELRRILMGLTREAGAISPLLDDGLGILAEADSLQARVRFGKKHGATFSDPESAGDSPGRDLKNSKFDDSLLLTDARHPLLEARLERSGGRVVPLTIELRPGERQLILSGPNTGGKTVALKTIGLLAMMGQAGIPVPAREARLPLLDAVFADIGDAQSIEQNLSTFSAHITKLNAIASAVADPEIHALVLMDELGSATDPEEGAALAVAIAEHFLQSNSWSIISTHHTSLKIYATNTPGVVNAAVGFDEATLAPTYEVRMRIPGASAGLNIARRLGLDPAIVDAARQRLATQTQDIGRFLDKLHAELDAAERERGELKTHEQEIARERSRLATEGKREQREKTRELEQKLEALLKEFEYQAREHVRAVDDRAAQQKISKDAERRIAKMRREFREQFNSAVVAHTSGADVGDPNAAPHVVKNVAVGDEVRLRSFGPTDKKTARVVRKVDENNFEVSLGSMKMRVPGSDIREVVPSLATTVTSSPLETARQRGIRVTMSDRGSEGRGGGGASTSEVYVIGQNVDEATRNVERFLDRAFLAGQPRVRIVHGTGMGILRKALREYLKGHPQVEQVLNAELNEGGAGATIVELKV